MLILTSCFPDTLLWLLSYNPTTCLTEPPIQQQKPCTYSSVTKHQVTPLFSQEV